MLSVATLVRGLTQQQAIRRQALTPRRIAARHERAVRVIVTGALTRSKRAISAEQVMAAVRVQSPDMLLAALFPITAVWAVALAPITPHLRDIWYASYLAADHTIERMTGAAFALPANPYADAIAWAEGYAAQLVSGVTEETRQAIRMLVGRAFAEGIPPRELAKLILQTTTLGLTGRGMDAVFKARAQMLALDPGRIHYLGQQRRRVPTGGYSDDDIDRLVGQYSQKLLGQRALTIARTETIRAAREGQQRAWARGLTAGRVLPTSRQRWSAAPDERTCPICQALDHQTIAMEDEVFVTITGAELDGPPAHPNCRCSLVLVP